MADIDINKIEQQIKEIKKSRRVNQGVVIGIVAVVGLLGLVLIIGMLLNALEAPSPVGSAIECTTSSCFIKAANKCMPAIYETQIETVTLWLETTEDCKLKKKVVKVDSKEPESIQNLFNKAEMTCPYEKGEFDEKYIEQISYDMLTCQGTLVDAVKKIL